MKEPCDNCPFRKDKKAIPLPSSRRKDIADSILRDSSFSCHKTTTFDENGNHQRTPNERPCIGAGRFIAANHGDVRANLMFRIEIMRGVLDPDDVNNFENAEVETETDYHKFTK